MGPGALAFVVEKKFVPFQTVVVAHVKLKGFLQVRPGDLVTVTEMEAGNASCIHDNEMGKIPVIALVIDHHCFNVHLQANIKIMNLSPSLLHYACAELTPIEPILDHLSLFPGNLVRAVATLVAIEV